MNTLGIYAVKDRLVDYFMPPFIGPSDKAVMTSIADLINGESKHAIAQAPHHFEIWKLGQVDEEGYLSAERSLVADCASLVRAEKPATSGPVAAKQNGSAIAAVPETTRGTPSN